MKFIILTTVFLFSSVTVFSQKNIDECPKFGIIGPTSVIQMGGLGVFSLKGDERFNKMNLSYNWTVSNGEIYDGQGTQFLIVKSSSKENRLLKASVLIQGLPVSCAYNISGEASFQGEPKPILIDESGKAEIPGNLKAGLDNYFVQLNNDSSAEAIIVFESKTKSAVVEQINKISKAIFFRKYDSSRVTYRIIINKDKENTAYWLIPSGALLSSTEGEININASEYENVRNFFTINQRTRKK